MIEGACVNVLDFGAVGDDSTDCTAAIIAAMDALPASGGTVYFPAGAYRVSSIDFTGYSYITFQGEGDLFQTTIRWTTTTGNVFNMSNSKLMTFRNLNFIPAAQKTSGSLFYFPAGGYDFHFRDIRISSALLAFDIDGADNFWFERITLNDYQLWPWSHVMRVGATTQSASINIDTLTLISQMTFAGAAIYIVNVDTFIARNVGIQKQLSGAMTGVWIAGGEFIQFHQSHFECGSTAADAILIGAAATPGPSNVNFVDCHCTTSLYGLRIVSGQAIEFIGGRLYYNGRNAVRIEGGTNVIVTDVAINDNNTAAGSWDAIFVAADVTYFRLIGNGIGSVRGVPVPVRYGIYVSDGVSNNYVIANNTITNYSTGAVYNGGTGPQQSVENNTNSQENYPIEHVSLLTLDATPTNIWTHTLLDEQSYYIKATVVGQDTATNSVFAYQRTCLVYRNGGSATIQGQSSIDTIETTASADCVFVTSSNDVSIQITGVAGTGIRWRANVEVFRNTRFVA